MSKGGCPSVRQRRFCNYSIALFQKQCSCKSSLRLSGPPAIDEDESLVDQLKEMGFPEELSREALRRTKNDSISAMDWLLENEKVITAKRPTFVDINVIGKVVSRVIPSSNLLNDPVT